MTVAELKEYLEQFPNEAEVRLATQPRYPFENSIDSVVIVEGDQFQPVVYISERSQIGYLPENAREELGW